MAEVAEAETKLPLLPSLLLPVGVVPLLKTCLIVDSGVLRVFVGIGVTRTASGRLEVSLSLLENEGKEPIRNDSISCIFGDSQLL